MPLHTNSKDKVIIDKQKTKRINVEVIAQRGMICLRKIYLINAFNSKIMEKQL